MNILIIEDDEVFSIFLCDILHDNGYNVICKKNYVDALNFIKSDSLFHIDVVLIDYFLKGVPVDKIIQMIKEKAPKTVLVVMSADIESAKDSFSGSFNLKKIDAFLQKPFTFHQLESAIKQIFLY